MAGSSPSSVPTKGAGPSPVSAPARRTLRQRGCRGNFPHPGSRCSTDLLEGAGEEVDKREPEDQGEHPPLPQEPAPHHSRQVHHPGAERGRRGAPAAWPLRSRQPHSSRRAPAPRPSAQPAPVSHLSPPHVTPPQAPPPHLLRHPPGLIQPPPHWSPTERRLLIG